VEDWQFISGDDLTLGVACLLPSDLRRDRDERADTLIYRGDPGQIVVNELDGAELTSTNCCGLLERR
jgi:hypothetical protein